MVVSIFENNRFTFPINELKSTGQINSYFNFTADSIPDVESGFVTWFPIRIFDSLQFEDDFYTNLSRTRLKVKRIADNRFLARIAFVDFIPNTTTAAGLLSILADIEKKQLVGFNKNFFHLFAKKRMNPSDILGTSLASIFVPALIEDYKLSLALAETKHKDPYR